MSHIYHEALFCPIFKLVEMLYNHVFVLRILKHLKRCHVWPTLVTSRVFVAR